MKDRPISVPIAVVTVLEDRAQITRRANVDLPAGVVRLRVAAVAPVLADRTLVARVENSGGEVTDARVERRHRERHEEDETLAALRRELEEGELDQIALERERSRAADRLDQLEILLSARLAEAGEDAAWGQELGPVASQVAELRGAARSALDEVLRLVAARDRMQRHLSRLRLRIAEQSRRPFRPITASLIIDLRVEEAGALPLRIDYLVPAAAWRPQHVARLAGDQLIIETDGCIWQNTGEDWDEVDLVLSTERLSLGGEPPVLASDELRVQRRQPAITVEARDQRVEATPLEASLATELPGIDDGGAPLALRPSGRATIPSDGRPHRVRLGSLEATAELELVGRPELDSNVHLVARLSNAAVYPLLAGPVDVIRGGGMSGRSKILFVGPGERFEIGLGPEPDLRLRRDAEIKVDEARLLSSWTRTHHLVTVRISNLGGETRRLRIRERIPVSEIEKVKITFRSASGGVTPDEDGFLDFERELAPRGTDLIEVRYHLDRHDDVIGL